MERDELVARIAEIDPEDVNVHTQERLATYRAELAALDAPPAPVAEDAPKPKRAKK